MCQILAMTIHPLMLPTCIQPTNNHTCKYVMLQQAVMGEKMEEMSQEERKNFISQQMDALQHELEKASADVHLVVRHVPYLRDLDKRFPD